MRGPWSNGLTDATHGLTTTQKREPTTKTVTRVFLVIYHMLMENYKTW